MASGTGTTKETRVSGPLKLPEVGWSHLMFACSSLVTIESASYPSLFTSVAVLLVFWLFLCLVTPEAKGKETNIY